MSEYQSMQAFKDEMLLLLQQAMEENSQEEFIEFSSGTFKCRVRVDRLEAFMAKVKKLPGQGVKDPINKTHKQRMNNFRRSDCAARLDRDNY